MSPTSYQTAPPRGGPHRVAPLPALRARAACWRRSGACLLLSLGDISFRCVDLGLVGGQIACLQGVLRILEMPLSAG